MSEVKSSFLFFLPIMEGRDGHVGCIDDNKVV